MRYNNFFKLAILILMVSACSCFLLYNITVASAQQGKGKENGKDVIKENKAVSGRVGFINSQFISIIDREDDGGQGEHETLYYLDDVVNVERKENLSEIKVGDTVQIQYEKTTKTDKEGVRKGKKVVKGVKFLREAQKKTKDSTLKSGKK